MGAEKTIPLVEVLPATPSLQDLNQMTDPIVVVTKILKTGTNREESQLVINGKHFSSVDKIIELQDLIPRPEFPKGGPGTYKFEVVDGASGARVAWKIRLGQGDNSGDLGVSSLPSSTSQGTVVSLPPLPLSPESQSLGNGWAFNSALNVLTSPSGRLYSWHKGQPLPEESYPVAQSYPAAQTTPIGQPMFPVVDPKIEAMQRSLEATQAQLNEAREQQKEQAHREELARIQDSFTRTMTDMQTRYEAMLAKFTEKPAEDPKLAILERQLADQARERSERDRFEAIRSETNTKLAALETALRDTNKADPMIPFLTQFIAQIQQSSQQTLAMMRESSQQQLALAAQNTLTPEKLLVMLREQTEAAQSSGSSLMNEKVMSFMNTMLDTALRFQRAQSEFSGGNNGVDWASLISSIGDRAGGAIQAVAQARMREAAATEAKAKAVTAATRARVQQQPQQQRLPPTTVAPAAAPTASEANDAMRDRMAEQMGMVPKAAEAPEEPEPASEPEEPTSDEQAAAVAEQLAQLKKMRTPQLRRMLNKASDDAFFGPFLSEVKRLRAELIKTPDAHTASDVAKYVLDARTYIAESAQADGKIPIVIEMFGAEQYEYLIERLLPKAPKDFRTAVLESLHEQLAEEVREEESDEEAGTSDES